MSPITKTVLALVAALMLAASPAMAKELGVFQTADRMMDFKLSTCGTDDQDLCVTLLAAREHAASAKVVPYIGKYVVANAKREAENAWRGTMHYGKYDLSGTMTLKPGVSFVVSGCVMLFVCDDINLIPAR